MSSEGSTLTMDPAGPFTFIFSTTDAFWPKSYVVTPGAFVLEERGVKVSKNLIGGALAESPFSTPPGP